VSLPRRSSEDRQLGGVCGGIGPAVGVDAAWVRMAFIVLFLLGGLGALVYAVLWRVLPTPPGGGAPLRSRHGVQEAVGLGALALAGVFAMASTGLLIAPAALALLAVAVASAGLLARRSSVVRGVAGSSGAIGALLLIGGAGALFSLGVNDLQGLPTAAASLAVAGTGAALMAGPRLRRARAEAASEKAQRIRADERAHVAARLHDSVLQTLALVQRTEQLAAAKRLARAQERQLRAWLYGGQAPDDPVSLGAGLREVAADVEERYGISIELVQTADVALDARLADLADAVREACTNAAKHSGADRVSVYVQLTPDTATIFVRDEGRGFDPAAVPDDRRGLRDSVMRRLAAHGGAATISTEIGIGTELELRLPLTIGERI
jgi:signal transduction histidine kinase